MCGIAGFLGFEDKSLIRSMCKVIEHRGPDSQGVFTDKNISMGVRRLSIIDRKGGNQPIHNEDETVWVVFNGEIYNYLELRKELEQKGHRFYTKSDTEVLVHLYEEEGEGLAARLRGMFAFAIWDAAGKKLFIARDRMGKKPLYYYAGERGFYFASEIKSILVDGSVPRRVDRRAFDEFLAFRSTVGEDTLFKDIRRLMPGSSITVRKGKLIKKKYWELKITTTGGSERHYLEKLKKLLEESVRIRLMSEVPLGAYLSGGVDSSVIVALMKKFSEKPVRTFSVGFGNDFDETKHARQVSDALGTDHTEFIVKENSMKILPEVIWHFDEPVADPAALPTYLLSERAKKKVTVVMTGEGADEIFAGYFQYKAVSTLGSPLRHGARLLPHLPKTVLNRIFEYTSSLGEKGMERFGQVLKEKDYRDQYVDIVSVFDGKERMEMTGYSGKYISAFPKTERPNSVLNNMLAFDIATELHGDLLMKVDKMTMAHSIEARAPFLDMHVVDLAFSMPASLKLRGTRDKYILRKIAAGLLPKNIAERKKHRFFLPIDQWGLKDTALAALTEKRAREIGINYSYVEKMVKGFEKSRLYYSRQLWSLLNFDLWHKIYIEKEKRSRIKL